MPRDKVRKPKAKEPDAEIAKLRTALGDVIHILDRVGGFLRYEEQILLRLARLAYGGS